MGQMKGVKDKGNRENTEKGVKERYWFRRKKKEIEKGEKKDGKTTFNGLFRM